MEDNKKNIPEENELEKSEEAVEKTATDGKTESAEADLEINAESDDIQDDKKPKKKGKAKRIILWILAVILAIVIIIVAVLRIVFPGVWRIITWDNITAAWNSWWYSSEDIERQMLENKKKMEKLAEEDPLIEIRGELTEEEVLALKNGEITQEEAASIVKGDITLEQIRENKKKQDEGSEDTEPVDEPSSEETPPQTPTNPEANDKVSQIVSELYVIQADFITRLEAIGDQAYADYKATHYDRSKVMAIVDSYTATVGEMEAECDKKVNSLVKELKSELAKVGRDDSLAREIQNYYYTEKSLKKSYYLNKLDDEDYK